jgi:hypothetical protein
MFSAGSMAILGTVVDLERLSDDDEDEDGRDEEAVSLRLLLLVLKKEGKRACAICMERTDDMMTFETEC